MLSLVASLHQAIADGSSHAPTESDDYLVVYEIAGAPDEFKEALVALAMCEMVRSEAAQLSKLPFSSTGRRLESAG
ncbi:hypothetical protein MESS2_1220030 [Mesorhizobium metallidurans STM 2683]|uniref:Uncharacterized protein n=1 Tax=Mesorhizobium metallidurans STM 2683 TaxID=1297569 RepID=M5EJB3_9HYPH|nr:hypothetical protein MESS2_1220030 [Mesorhizobium metallidurans STM 2683]